MPLTHMKVTRFMTNAHDTHEGNAVFLRKLSTSIMLNADVCQVCPQVVKAAFPASALSAVDYMQTVSKASDILYP